MLVGYEMMDITTLCIDVKIDVLMSISRFQIVSENYHMSSFIIEFIKQVKEMNTC